MNYFKSLVAIINGFLSVGALSIFTDIILLKIGVLPPGALFDPFLLSIVLTYRTIYTILGGFLVAKLAPEKPVLHAVIMGAIGMIPAIFGAVVMKEYGPMWYSLAIVIEAIPCTYIGARLAIRGRN